MNKYFLYLPLLILVLFSCSKKETEVVNVPVLRASAIYNADSVYTYIKLYEDKNRVIALSYLDKASKVEESDTKKAIYYTKRAITLLPEYDTYKKLGKLLFKSGMHGEALKAYSMISSKSYVFKDAQYQSLFIFKQPEQDDLYEYLAASIIENNYLSSYEIHEAKENGFNIGELKEKLLKDERIKLDHSSAVFKNILLRFMSDEELEVFQKSATFYADLVSSIKDTSVVFEINEAKVAKFKYNLHDGEEMEESFTDMFIYFLKEKLDNPDNWYDYNFNHLVKINDSVDAVFYSIDTSEYASPLEMRHIYHRVVTYKKGEIIDSKIIALQSGQDLTTMVFNKNTIQCSEFSRVWKKTYNKKDFDNEIVSKKIIGQKTYIIKEDGKIEESNSTESTPAIVPATDSTSS